MNLGVFQSLVEVNLKPNSPILTQFLAAIVSITIVIWGVNLGIVVFSAISSRI